MAFSALVTDATKEKDPKELDTFLGAQQERAKAAQEHFGSIYDTRAPELSQGARMAAERTWGTGEQARREAATKGAYDIAGKVDTRSTQVIDQVRAALRDREGLGTDLATKQRQQDRTQQQTLTEQNQNFINRLAQIDYQGTEQAAARMDSMQTAYDRGTLEFQMADLDRQGMLGLSDIERYFSIQLNDMDNAMKWLDMTNKADYDKMMGKIESQSKGWATVLESITKAGQEWATRPKGVK